MEQQDQGASGAGGVGELVKGVDAGLQKLIQVAAQANLPEEIQSGLSELAQAFRSLVEKAVSGGQPEEAPEASGTAPMESGGNPNAKPAM